MKIIDFYNSLSELYPKSLSSSWDNDGLMCCMDKDREVKRVLVSLDATDEAIDYAVNGGFDTLLTHHPLIFKGLKALNDMDVVGRRVIKAAASKLSVISLHTRLDAGDGGVNDTLASLLGLCDVEKFGDDDNPSLGRIGTSPLSDAKEFASKIKEATGVPSITAYLSRPVNKVAVIGGGGGDLIGDARRAGADTLVTGECSYNRGLDAGDSGMNIFIAGHYFTEMPVCEKLAELCKSIAGAEVEIFTSVPESHF